MGEFENSRQSTLKSREICKIRPNKTIIYLVSI